jgi:hypothetical protein
VPTQTVSTEPTTRPRAVHARRACRVPSGLFPGTRARPSRHASHTHVVPVQNPCIGRHRRFPLRWHAIDAAAAELSFRPKPSPLRHFSPFLRPPATFLRRHRPEITLSSPGRRAPAGATPAPRRGSSPASFPAEFSPLGEAGGHPRGYMPPLRPSSDFNGRRRTPLLRREPDCKGSISSREFSIKQGPLHNFAKLVQGSLSKSCFKF